MAGSSGRLPAAGRSRPHKGHHRRRLRRGVRLIPADPQSATFNFMTEPSGRDASPEKRSLSMGSELTTRASPRALWAAVAGHLLVLIAAATGMAAPKTAIVAAIRGSLASPGLLLMVQAPDKGKFASRQVCQEQVGPSGLSVTDPRTPYLQAPRGVWQASGPGRAVVRRRPATAAAPIRQPAWPAQCFRSQPLAKSQRVGRAGGRATASAAVAQES
jgi:hypothetical protein